MTDSWNVRHLLGLEFAPGVDAREGRTDCMGLAREALRSNGREEAAATISYDPIESVRIAEEIEAGLLPAWEVVGDSPEHATELGDVLIGPGRSGLHVETLVSLRPRRTLTSTPSGGSRLRDPRQFKSCRSVLRSRS